MSRQPASRRPGDRVGIRFRKWDGGAHWAFQSEFLGRDEHGSWVGGAAGTPMSRPGAAFDCASDWVMLLPHEAGYVASFNAHGVPGLDIATYVDISTVPHWGASADGGHEVHMVDLDLDVVALFDGRVYVDDEDEFAAHRETFGYPADVVSAAEAGCARLLRAVTERTEPFGGVGHQWLAGFSPAGR